MALSSMTMCATGGAEQNGDKKKGHTIARTLCAECHAVEAGQTRSPNSFARPFQIIASMPSATPVILKAWFRSPHPTMPNFIVRRDDEDHLIAYILSLKPE